MSEWHGGKGSSPRRVDKSKYDSNFDAIFRNVVLDKPAMWKHTCHDGEIWVGEGQPCNWCGEKEDGSKEL